MMQMTRGLRLDAHRAEWCLKEEEEKMSRTRRRRSVEARAYGPRSLLVTSLLSSIIITMIITLSLSPATLCAELCTRDCIKALTAPAADERAQAQSFTRDKYNKVKI